MQYVVWLTIYLEVSEKWEFGEIGLFLTTLLCVCFAHYFFFRVTKKSNCTVIAAMSLPTFRYRGKVTTLVAVPILPR